MTTVELLFVVIDCDQSFDNECIKMYNLQLYWTSLKRITWWNNGIMRYGKDVRVNVFNPGYIIHMSTVWSKSISVIRHCQVSFLQDGGKWNPQSWQGLTKSALVFLQYLEIYSLQCRDCLVSQFYLNIRLDLHLLSLPKLPNLQFTQIPNYQIWIMSCETFSVNIFLLLIFHFLSIPFSIIIGVSILYKCTFSVFVSLKNSMSLSSWTFRFHATYKSFQSLNEAKN